MGNSKEGLYSLVIRRFDTNAPGLANSELLDNPEKSFLFAMACNGLFLKKSGKFEFNSLALTPFFEEFRGQKVSFFGPGDNNIFFATSSPAKADLVREQSVVAFRQQSVHDVVNKFAPVDEDQAARIAYLLGGIVRHLVSRSPTRELETVAQAVDFVARMTKLAERKSAEAVASAMAMYVISGGSCKEDRYFAGNVYRMAEAIRQDAIVPQETADLGLSQVARLKAFVGAFQGRGDERLPNITEYKPFFAGFPTVGAEFHFPIGAQYEYPNFWQRLAILNMSQYQRGSYVQFSRNDRGVIEVRMNPSIYPITIANWNLMRLLLPELNQAYFTITLNRIQSEGDFSWGDSDWAVLEKLRAIGMLCFMGIFEEIPRLGPSEEINFGSVYLGQTVRLTGKEYRFTGNWSGREGAYGQLGIHTGFGDNLPHLAYYLSMALACSDTLLWVPERFWSRFRSLKAAQKASSQERRLVFTTMQNYIESNERLRTVFETGNEIIDLLSS